MTIASDVVEKKYVITFIKLLLDSSPNEKTKALCEEYLSSLTISNTIYGRQEK